MKIGDLVIINVPPNGEKHWPSCHGIIVEKKEFRSRSRRSLERTWWYILRGDTGTIESFHEDWMTAGANGSW